MRPARSPASGLPGVSQRRPRPTRSSRLDTVPPAYCNPGLVQIRPLRRYHHPDLSDYVVHFTGRKGGYPNSVPAHIRDEEPWSRLGHILAGLHIKAFPPFGSDVPTVCFTECTVAGIQSLMKDRYPPCGVAFDKEFIFRRGGGPAYYVRGDEWPQVQGLPDEIRFRATRWWPGAVEVEGESLPNHLRNPSEWLHEREWRVRGAGTPSGFDFDWADVAFIVAPDPAWQSFIGNFIGGLGGAGYEEAFMAVPVVVVAEDGSAIDDPHGIWL